MNKKINEFYTLGEEIAHGITHGIGAGLSIAGLTALIMLVVIHDPHPGKLASSIIYGCSLIMLYLASTLYHSIQSPKAKRIFRVLDHSAIYLLIAGTYTPFVVMGINSTLGWVVLGIVWGMAILGIGFKVFFTGRFPILSTVFYVVMGWACVIAWGDITANVPSAEIAWLIAGGITYSVGVIFYAATKMPYSHAIWHLFVLGGSVCHYVAVVGLVVA